MLVKAKDDSVLKAIEKNRAYIEKFCNPEELQIGINLETPEKAMTAVITGLEIILPLEVLINIEEEIARLTKEYDKFTKEVERVEKKLNNPGFMKKAPESVVEEERAKEKDYREKRTLVEARLNELKGL
jgi:valyl-tRNA synthetase